MHTITRLLLCLATIPVFIACEPKPKTVGEKLGDKVDDALDRRPGEKVRDAGEDVKDAAKDAGDAVKDAVRK
jgi:hypothetical protein